MKITARLFATFRDGRQKMLEMDFPETATPNSVLDRLGITQAEVAILLVNGRDGKFDTLLVDNDTVSLFPPVGGGEMVARYSRNIATLSIEENESLSHKKVCVIGCGGLGGYIIEMLGRLGIGHITAVDGDVFEESNLNRQILSDVEVLGNKKAFIAKQRMSKVNPLVKVNAITERLIQSNGKQILSDADVVIDALDNIESRLILESLCEELDIPLVHGAIAGWYGQVSTILPGDKLLSRYYATKDLQGVEKKYGNPSFTPALVASIQVSEVLKLLIGRGELLNKKILLIDLLRQEYDVIEF